MTRIDSNTKMIGGSIFRRRFAYLSKKDHSAFGLLEAANAKDARRWLGKYFHIRQVWLSENEYARVTHRELQWEIISAVFLTRTSVAYIGPR